MFSRYFLLIAVASGLSVPAKVQATDESSRHPSVEKPNILFILADDLAYDAIGSTSQGEVITPHLDSLRDQGCLFSHVYNPGSWTPAVCQASRTMLNTGLTVWKAAKYNRKKTQDPLWSELMKKQGYETYFVGKWHVETVTPKEVFDHTGTVRAGMPQQTKAGYARKFIPGMADEWQPDDKKQGGHWEGGHHWSEVVADETCNFLQEAGKQEKPFFMYIAFNAPHDPRQSSPRHLDRYPVDKIKIPTAFLPEYPYCKEIGAGPKLRDEWLAPYPRTKYSIQVNRKEYYSIISHLDDQIGRILAQLKTKVKRPTYVIFTSDQGLSIGDHGFMGKQNLYEPSTRVPFLVSGPGIKAGSSQNTAVYMQSIMPTSLEMAGTTPPANISFPSLLPQLKSGETIAPQDMYGCMFDRQRMIKTDEWKLLIYPKANAIRLYHCRTDPHELKDVAADPQYRTIMDDLFRRLQKLQKENGDKINLLPVYNEFLKKGSGSVTELSSNVR